MVADMHMQALLWTVVCDAVKGCHVLWTVLRSTARGCHMLGASNNAVIVCRMKIISISTAICIFLQDDKW